MHLSQRSHSINTYCLSKVWFKCPSVNLRACDFLKFSASIKSWLFQDQLEKPEDFVLYRPRNRGGLGLLHAECKSQALMIRSFMETAANPKFKKNLYHKALYSWHVLSDRTIPNPGLPPYYDAQFFMKIKAVLEEGLLNVTTMSSSTWYKVLLENSITHIVDKNRTLIFKTSRAELNFPERNWEMIWHLAVTPGLPSELLSFLWPI